MFRKLELLKKFLIPNRSRTRNLLEPVVRRTINTNPWLPCICCLVPYILWSKRVHISHHKTLLNPLKLCHLKCHLSPAVSTEFVHKIFTDQNYANPLLKNWALVTCQCSNVPIWIWNGGTSSWLPVHRKNIKNSSHKTTTNCVYQRK